MWFDLFTLQSLAVDLCNFFLKTLLWVPPDNKLLVVRVSLWGFASVSGIAELYEYVHTESCQRFGVQAWLNILMSFFEVAIVLRHVHSKTIRALCLS